MKIFWILFFLVYFHHFAPLEIACDGDDDVEGIEGGLEGNVLVEIEYGGDDVDGNPDEPLLQVFVCQRPDADDAEGSGERVGKGDCAVGEGHQEPVDGSPDGGDEQCPGENEAAGEMTDKP